MKTDQLICQYSTRKRPITDRKYKASVVPINRRFLFCRENSIVIHFSLVTGYDTNPKWVGTTDVLLLQCMRLMADHLNILLISSSIT